MGIVHTKTAHFIAVAAAIAPGMAHVAVADSATGTIDMEWIISTPVFGTLSLPEVLSIDSIEVEIAHTNGSDLAISVMASDTPAEVDFDLMFQETADGGLGFSMGVVPGNFHLTNVAPYTFVPTGGGEFTAPHTPSSVLNANSWTDGPLAAQEYTLFVFDLNLLFDGGAIGSWTVNYTPIPEPGACAALLLGGLSVTRRRRRTL